MTTIQVRRGTAAQWASAATVLAAGELGLDTTNNILKLGDASTAWASLNPVLNGTYAQRARSPIVQPTRLRPNLVATWQSGHGWADQGGTTGGSVVDDTSVYTFGSQSIAVTTPAVSNANRAIRKTGLTSVDLSGAQHFAVLLMVDQPTALGNIILTVGDDTFTNFKQYKAAYGNSDPVFATIRANSWQWVAFTKAEETGSTGTGGLSAVTAWQLRVNGGATSAVTVRFNALGYYAAPTAFPNGVVSFTFDDTYTSQFTLGRKILDKYGYPATAFTIVDQVGTGSRLSEQNLYDLQNLHGWEIAGHAYTTANHNAGFTALTTQQLTDELQNLRQWLSVRGFRGADLFAYPKSDENDALNQSVGQYFSFARLVTQQPYQPTRMGNRLRVRAYSVTQAITSATITGLIDSAYTNGWWLILACHDLVTTPSIDTEWATSNFQTVVDYCASKPIPVRTISEVITDRT